MTDQLRALVADILGMEANDVVAESGPGTTATWDSLAHLSIITAVEQHFDVRFSMVDIRSIDSFGSLAKALADRLVK